MNRTFTRQLCLASSSAAPSGLFETGTCDRAFSKLNLHHNLSWLANANIFVTLVQLFQAPSLGRGWTCCCCECGERMLGPGRRCHELSRKLSVAAVCPPRRMSPA
ncbi:hypothetical protein BASA81_007820 [Batrachochytrium salamandrivorans]|nr:hypothetical protein BASA81_007820 [Batrachochytrium salamandrivorans]